MPVNWINHKGKSILYVDYQGCNNEEDAIALLEETGKIMIAQPGKILVLANIANGRYGMDYQKRVKEFGMTIGLAKTEKHALIGVTGLKTILVNGFMRDTPNAYTQIFETREQALEWLVSP